MDEIFIFVLSIIIVVISGYFTGYNSNSRGWAKDCETIQVHRVGDSVYKCEKVK